jgi:hypothetical protein
MNKVLAILSLVVLFSTPVMSLAAPINTIQAQQEDKPKKEVLISIRSKYYRNPVQVIEGFFKQANIYDFSIEDDEKLEKMDVGNFQFKNKTIDQAIKRLSAEYKIVFEVEEVGKDKVYKVKMR